MGINMYGVLEQLGGEKSLVFVRDYSLCQWFN